MRGHVLIRADASSVIGTGHVIRCRTLAAALVARDWRATLASRDLSPSLARSMSSAGINTISLDDVPRGVSEVATIGAAIDAGMDGGPTVIVADHYGIDASWLHVARRAADMLVSIDDLADRAQPVDLMLNQNLGVAAATYHDLVLPGTRLLIGPRFALVRPEFAEHRKAAQAKDGTIRRIVVFLGGADPDDVTAQAVESLTGLPVTIEVIVGGAYPHLQRLRERIVALKDARLYVDTDDVALMMAEADLAIGAPGSASWERCTLRLPTVLVVLADNQAIVGRALVAAGAAESVGWHSEVTATGIRNVVTRLMADPGRVARMSEAAGTVTDGLGTERVVEAIHEELERRHNG